LAGHDDHGEGDAQLVEERLQLQPVHAGHAHIQEDAATGQFACSIEESR